MDFNDTPEEALFRADVRAFLETRRLPVETMMPRANMGPISLGDVAAAKQWQAEKAAAGLAGLMLPPRYGGRGGGPMMQAIYNEEEAKFAVPPSIFTVGLGMCIPTLMAWAEESLLERYVPPALRGEEIWCQLFSEPSAGSDLAGLRTRAVRAGDGWIVNGQKIWTSNAHFADWGVIMCRTNPDVPKHAGLTFFFLDMRSPGIEVRPIRQMSGASNFNEVFFTDVRIPDAQRLGAVDAGWRVSITTLMNERMSVGILASRPTTGDLIALARSEAASDRLLEDPQIRSQIVDFWIRERGVELINLRTMTALSKGREPGPESSISKLVSAGLAQEIATIGLELLDGRALVRADDDADLRKLFQDSYLVVPGIRIGGGTDEILRNIIAERVLGLPPEIRVDKNIPFSQLPAAAT